MAFGDALMGHGNRVVELGVYAIMGGVWALAADLGIHADKGANPCATKELLA